MSGLSVNTDIRLADWSALSVAARRRILLTGSRAQRLVRRLPALLFAVAAVVGVSLFPAHGEKLAWVMGVLLALAFILAASRVAIRGSRPHPGGIALGAARFDFDASGLRVTRPRVEATVLWSQVDAVESLPEHVILWLDTMAGYVIPIRDLPAPLTAAEFITRIEALRNAAPRAAGPDTPDAAGLRVDPDPLAITAAPSPAPAPSPGKELGAIARLLLLLRVDGARLAGGDIAIAALATLVIGAWIALDWLTSADDLVFAPYAIAGLAWYVLGFLALAWLGWRLSSPRVEFRRVLLITTGAAPIAIAGSLAFDLLGFGWIYAVFALFAAWALLYYRNALHALTGALQVRAVVVSAVAAFAFVVVTQNFLGVSPTVWDYAEEKSADDSQNSDDADSDEVWARVAALQFGQQARIDAELAKIAQHATPRPEVFFLGFAGNGRQRVFAEEIALASKVVGARYHVGDRTMRLVNDARDLERFPFATPEALRHALLGLGRIMDSDDVLFLAISSHGGEDGSIEIANAGRVPVGLAPDELEDMLRDAKIPHAVIVISACYAGAFVPVLADENTTVIAAAAEDRTSFGCADDRDLTYFGEAFYRDALPGAPTLSDAFDTARREIAERERQERIEPSEPQARFGTLVQPQLERLGPGAQDR